MSLQSSYCTNAEFIWKTVEQPPGGTSRFEETGDLASRAYGLEMLWIVDDNFLVDLERVLEIAEGLVPAKDSFAGAFRRPRI